jgi:hypothetical protein
MSKFLLNHLVEIIKLLPKIQIYLKFKNQFPFEISPRIRSSSPASAHHPHRPPPPRSAQLARDAFVHSPKVAFSSCLRIPAVTPSLSHVVAMQATHVSSFLSPLTPLSMAAPPSILPHLAILHYLASSIKLSPQSFTPPL